MLRHLRAAIRGASSLAAGRPSLEPGPPPIDPRWLSLVATAGRDAALVVDEATVVRFASPAVTPMLGYDAGALPGTRLLELVRAEDAPELLATVTDTLRGTGPLPPREWRLRGVDGRERLVEAVASPAAAIDAPGGAAPGLVLLQVRDLSARAHDDHASPMSDALTGLAHRALFRDRVAHALARAGRGGTPLAVLAFDVDGFRAFNDAAGPAAGDALLVAIAGRLAASLRGSDTAARVGADEFAVLLEDMADESDFHQVAARLVESLATPFTIAGRDVAITTSVGMAVARPEDDAADLIRNADVALAIARRGGRGRSEYFEPRMHAEIAERLQLELDLHRALERGQFELHFQPIVILHSRRIAGVEALLRWRHPERGLVRPAAFLRAAEELGLIVPLGRWVLAEACRHVKRWQGDLENARALTVAVNVSGAQLRHPGFFDDVADALRETRLDPHRIVLEVADDVVLGEPRAALSALRALKALGVRVALDDFGARRSSLRDLPGLPVDILKIDRAFIDRVHTVADADVTFAQAIVALAKSMRLRTVAEGIDGEDQLAELLRVGCEFGQGSLFGDALPPEKLEALLRLQGPPAARG